MAEPGKVAPAVVDFTFRSPYPDLAELLPTTPGAPFLPNATGGGRVAIDRLKQGKLDVSAVLADVKLSPGLLESPKFSLQGYGGTVTGEARFDLRDTRKPATAVHAVVSKVKADAILGVWSPVKDLLAGRASEALTEQRTKLETQAKQEAQRALLEKLGAPRDSAAAPVTVTSARDTLRTAAKGLFEGLFGKKPPPPSPSPAPAPAPAPVPDTTQH